MSVSNINKPIKGLLLYATSYLMAIVTFALSATILDIYHSRNVHDLDLSNRSRSNVNMPIESPYVTSYLMVIVFCPVFVSGVFAVEMVHNLELENEPRSNTNMPIENRCVTFHLLTTLTFFYLSPFAR